MLIRILTDTRPKDNAICAEALGLAVRMMWKN